MPSERRDFRTGSERIASDAISALDELASKRAAMRAPLSGEASAWSTVADVAGQMDVSEGDAEAAIGAAVGAGLAIEHPNWPAWYRLTDAGRAVVDRDLFKKE